MTTWSRFLCLVLAWTFISTLASAALPTIHVTDKLPANSEPVKIECSSQRTSKHLGQHTLKAGDVYEFTAVENDLHFCEAERGNYFASWHALEPSRDGTHKDIYWQVKDDGFYLSWDNSHWSRKEVWETD